jgi:hypothetical protein
LITATKIPKNHDAIIEAWKAAGRKLEADETFISRVADDILEQKKEAEAEAAAKEAKEQKKVTGFVRKECWELLRQEPARAVCFYKEEVLLEKEFGLNPDDFIKVVIREA